MPAASSQTIKIQIMKMVDNLFCNLPKLGNKNWFGLDWNYVNLQNNIFLIFWGKN